jgi:nucleoid-associated protein YgaU
MNLQLTCPVCSYRDITGDTCPNCDTDLSVIRLLQELPAVETPVEIVKVTAFPLRIALLMLMIGICLGVGGSFILQTTYLHTLTVSSAQPVASNSPIPQATITNPSLVAKTPPKPTTYTVKAGDYLSAIAQKLCGKNTSWQIMVEANPQLKGRENSIDVGEVFKIPNCQEQAG